MRRKSLSSWRTLAPFAFLCVLTLALFSVNSVQGQIAEESVTSVNAQALLTETSALSLASKADFDPSLRLQDAGADHIVMNSATNVVSFVTFGSGNALQLVRGGSASAQAEAFFTEYGSAFGISDLNQVGLVKSYVDYNGATHLEYAQVYNGVPVYAGILKVHLDTSNAIYAVNGVHLPNLAVNTIPTLSADAAANIALARVATPIDRNQTLDVSVAHSTLYVYRDGLVLGIAGENMLVYEVEVGNGHSVREFVYVEAHSGKIINQISGIHHALDRKVYEASLGNPPIWEDSAGDPYPIPGGWEGGTVQQVTDWQNEIDGAAETYNVIASLTGGSYLSYDAADATMLTVNNDPGINCPNANWNGTSTNYCSGVTGDDTVAHEWGHAYTEYTNGLIYQWESGALNESYSDIWGEVIDFLNGRGLDSPISLRSTGGCSVYGQGPNDDDSYRWLSGEDDPAFGGAIRDMWNPTCYGDPGKVSDTEFVCSTADSGGVHSNSGVNNHAFALTVDGGTYNGQTITGIGLTKAAHIFWGAQNMLTPASGNFENAAALAASCSALIGTDLNTLNANVPTTTPSGEIISAGDCAELDKVILAVEFNTPPTQCNFQPLLDPNAPALCLGQGNGTVDPIVSVDWESGIGAWTVGTRDVANPATFDTPDWAVVGSLPDSRSGSALFVEDNPAYGDCQADTEAGVLFVESPTISLPATAAVPRVAFNHWVATEAGWDGGNVKVSVNGGAWQLVPAANFDFNAYNANINGGGNDNPLAGEGGFTGTDGGVVGGSWGQSQLNLVGLASPGDDINLRMEMGLDGCNGVVGWYVDEVDVYACEGETVEPPGPGESVEVNGMPVAFEAGVPVSFTTASTGNVYWTTTADGVGCPAPNWSGVNETPGSGEAACADADGNNNPPSPYSAEMWSNPVDLVNANAFTLTFAAAYNDITPGGNDLYEVDISTDGGSSWVNLLSWDEDHSEFVNLDLSTYAGNSVIVRWVYSGSDWDWWAQVDDISITSDNVAAPPSIAVDPTSIEGTQGPDTQVDHTLNISNNGEADLNWSIDESSTALPGNTRAGNVVADGSFEAGSPNPNWTEASTNFGSPLCTVGFCGTGTGTGPRTGDWWSWFGGIAASEVGSVTQDVTMPNGGAELSFWLEQIVCDSAADFMEVTIDGNQVFLTDGSNPICGNLGYVEQVVDVSAYADGGVHTLEFRSEIFANNGAGSNFFVDDISIVSTVPPTGCDAPSDISWASVSPSAGTTMSGTTSMVTVSYDSTGLSEGVYTGTLCVNSNDAMNPRVEVPLTMTVQTVLGAIITPMSEMTGTQGTTVSHMLSVTNSGNVPELIMMSVMSHTWPTTMTPMSMTLQPGESADVMVDVSIPVGEAGNTDTARVLANFSGARFSHGADVITHAEANPTDVSLSSFGNTQTASFVWVVSTLLALVGGVFVWRRRSQSV